MIGVSNEIIPFLTLLLSVHKEQVLSNIAKRRVCCQPGELFDCISVKDA